MASVKYKGRWYESTSLPIEIKIELGLDKEVLEDLDNINVGVKTAPCKKSKKTKLPEVEEKQEELKDELQEDEIKEDE